jgi:predicted RNA-binding protein with PUA-like domain
MQYWLVKSEPETYSWSALVKDGSTAWTGVRNFQARKNLREMKAGDLVLYYHTGEEKQVVGLARVIKEAYPDPTAKEGDWFCVDLEPLKPLESPVELKTIKADDSLKDIALVRNGRLSVQPLPKPQFQHILKLGKTALP